GARPTRLELAGRGAPVGARRVLVVALLGTGDLAVAAHDGVDARGAGRGAHVVRLDRFAVARAPVVGRRVVIVAGLADVQHAVAAHRDLRRRNAAAVADARFEQLTAVSRVDAFLSEDARPVRRLDL